jgi:hypothetical protein
VKAEGEAELLAGELAGRPQRVEVKVITGGKLAQTITGDQATVTAAWSKMALDTLVTIHVRGSVEVINTGDTGRIQRPGEWTRGELPIPNDILQRFETLNVEDLVSRPAELTSSDSILAAIKSLKNKSIQRLFSDIVAEMHGRIAYGGSCFLMVAMGAALGLMFRGGQLISAFVLSLIPASIVIVMVIMGKQMITNPQVPPYLGMAAIWGGVVMLLGANCVIYWHLMRR